MNKYIFVIVLILCGLLISIFYTSFATWIYYMHRQLPAASDGNHDADDDLIVDPKIPK